MAAELAALEGAKTDLEVSHAILVDRLKQARAENERLLHDVENFKTRITSATKDYVSGSRLCVKPCMICVLDALACKQSAHTQHCSIMLAMQNILPVPLLLQPNAVIVHYVHRKLLLVPLPLRLISLSGAMSW